MLPQDLKSTRCRTTDQTPCRLNPAMFGKHSKEVGRPVSERPCLIIGALHRAIKRACARWTAGTQNPQTCPWNHSWSLTQPLPLPERSRSLMCEERPKLGRSSRSEVMSRMTGSARSRRPALRRPATGSDTDWAASSLSEFPCINESGCCSLAPQRTSGGSCPSTWCNFRCATGPHRSGGLWCNL